MTSIENTRLDRRQRAVLLSAWSANGLVFLDQTASTVALPDIGRDLGRTQGDLHLVIGVYLIVLAAVMPVAGRLADIYGRRRIFLIGVAIFGIASVGCALAPSMGALIGARAVQGLGAAMSVPLALANVTSMLPPERRGWAGGALAAGGTVFLFTGPAIGGAFVSLGGWRLIFAINLPIVVFALYLAWKYLPRTSSHTGRINESLDPLGMVLLVVGLAAFVTGMLRASELGTERAVTISVGGAVLFVLFVVRQFRAENPLIDLRKLSSPLVTGGFVALFAAQFAILAVTVELMLFLQGPLGYGALLAGIAFLPTVFGTPLLSTWTGRIADRTGPGKLAPSGLLIAAVGLAWLTWASGRTEYLLLVPGFILFGLSRPLIMTPATTRIIGAMPPEQRGVAASLATEARQLGAVFGVVVAGVLVNIKEREGFVSGFQLAMACTAALCAVSGFVAWLLLRRGATVP